MAENTKYTVSHSGTRTNRRWLYRLKFCRETGVNFLYGKKLLKIPREKLWTMIGACSEGLSNPFLMMLAIMRLLRELTVETFLDRPMYSIRHAWRRIKTKRMLADVLEYLARVCNDDRDLFVAAVMDILVPGDETPIWSYWWPDSPENEDSDDKALADACKSDVKEETDTQEPEKVDGVKVADTPEEVLPESANFERNECGRVAFLDAAAFKEYQNQAVCGTEETKTKLANMQILLSGPSFSDFDAKDPLAWAAMMKEAFNLTVSVEYVAPAELPWLYTSLSRTNLAKRDYYIVKYAVYFTQLIPDLVVDLATPGLMELYEEEMARVRTRNSFITLISGATAE